MRRGNAFVELGEFQQAIDDFSALISIDRHVAGYFDNRLRAYRPLGRYDDALADAETVVRMASGQAFGHRSRGLVHADMNRLDLAVADFTTAISLDPANAGLYLDRGRFLVRAGRLGEAVGDFGRALQIDGGVFDAYRERGLALVRLGDADGALADLTLYARTQPGDDARFIQISAPVQPGDSGGPVLDQSGKVIGVVVAKLDALKLAKLKDDVPQNVNFALKTGVLVGFLDTTGVVYATAGQGTQLAPPDIAERAKAISAYIRCRS